MELRRYLAIAWRWSWLLLLGTVLGGLLAFMVSRAQTPIYQATATVLVNQSQSSTGATYNDVIANQQLTPTYERLVTSGPVLEQAGERLGYSYDQMREKVSASSGRETQLIDISARDKDPELAAQIANETASVFAEQIRQAQLGQQTTIESDLTKQIIAVQASLDERQQRVFQLTAQAPDPQRNQQLADAQSQLDSLRQNLASLQQRLQDVRIDLAKSINSVTLADPARVPQSPVSPRTLMNAVLGAVLGLIVVAWVVVLAEYLDDTVKSAEDVELAAGVATLGFVPRFTPKQGRLPGRRTIKPRLITSLGGRSRIAEVYRVVRTNLEFARSHRSGRTMLVTSALPGEGKSTTAANLALLLAESGQRVILVDADLRRRSLHGLFDVPNTTGLSTLFVMDEPQLAGFLRPTSSDNLLLLPSGPTPPNPAELLASARMRQIIDLLKAEADVVIFDSPPLLGVADSAGLAPSLDGVVLVANAGRTRTGAVAQAAEILNRAGAALWGVVLNKVKAGRHYGYYYYGGYYGEPDERPPKAPRGDAAPRGTLSGDVAPVMQARIQKPDG